LILSYLYNYCSVNYSAELGPNCKKLASLLHLCIYGVLRQFEVTVIYSHCSVLTISY